MTRKEPQNLPLITQCLGDGWKRLHPAIKNHYGLIPDCSDEICLNGVMNIHYPRKAFLLLAMARLTGGLVLLREEDIPVRVKNSSQPGSKALFWHRSFSAPGRKTPVYFRSLMEYSGADEVTEYVQAIPFFEVGVRMKVHESGGRLHFESTGYTLRLGKIEFPVPGQLLLGRASIVEQATGPRELQLHFTLNHPLFGEIYRYGGVFTLVDQGYCEERHEQV